ncbi:unnamed protein product [Cuscuta campestris]|uniref:Uncharacterized protein n=1 Tax=Cuscuta campestris TaxID=132261 RepID=A0A484LLT6_9ASTE|nr:unnamed protein product [Cuscuta campestris]
MKIKLELFFSGCFKQMRPETMPAAPIKTKEEPALAVSMRRHFTREGSRRRTSAPPRSRKICPFCWRTPTFTRSRPRSCASPFRAPPAPNSSAKAGSAQSSRGSSMVGSDWALPLSYLIWIAPTEEGEKKRKRRGQRRVPCIEIQVGQAVFLGGSGYATGSASSMGQAFSSSTESDERIRILKI